MPGFIDERYRCKECGGVDPGMVGLIVHRPTCSTQPGHLEARMREAVQRAERRVKRAAYMASAEAQRLRELRTIEREEEHAEERHTEDLSFWEMDEGTPRGSR